MLVDQTLTNDLNTPQAARTLDFVKRVLAGLLYVDIQLSSSTLTCQVKSGDGQNHVAVTNVMVRLAATDLSVPPTPPATPSVSMISGTLKSGTGTNTLWVQSTSAGTFSFSVSGSGSILVELTPNQGVAMSVGIG